MCCGDDTYIFWLKKAGDTCEVGRLYENDLDPESVHLSAQCVGVPLPGKLRHRVHTVIRQRHQTTYTCHVDNTTYIKEDGSRDLLSIYV